MTDPTKAGGLTLTGGGALAKTFRGLAESVRGAALEAATRSAALPVLNQVRITVPQGGRTPYKSGTYRRGWHMETVEKSPDRCVVQIGNDQPQSRRLELGFVGPDKLGRVYNQAPRPHVRPAFDENVERAKTEFRDAMAETVEREASKRAD